MPAAPLYAISTSLPEFFASFEAFVRSLDCRVRVSLGSISASSARFSVDSDALATDERYLAYKQEAFEIGPALLTSIAVEHEGRALEFQLQHWKRCLVPVEFDQKMVYRHWLSLLARVFELRTDASADDRGSGGSDARDAAYATAIRHFEEAAASVAETNAETASAAQAFFADAAKQLARQRQTFQSAFDAEQAERKEHFARQLAETVGLDVREHGVARRELLRRLDEITRRRLQEGLSEATRRLRRRIAWTCGGLLIVGGGLMVHGLAVEPLSRWRAVNSVPALRGLRVDWLGDIAVGGIAPLITFAAGTLILLLAASVWLRHLVVSHRQSITRDLTNDRFQRDLLRMSWIAELHLETADRQRPGGDAALPPLLLERFSRQLFEEDAGSGGSLTKEEAAKLAAGLRAGERTAAGEVTSGTTRTVDETPRKPR